MRAPRPIARAWSLVCLVAVLAAVPSPASAARPGWAKDLDALIGDRPFSVVVGRDGETWYRHLAWVPRPPASNEKLLLSMALLARYEPGKTIRTEARADGEVVEGVLRGNLWIVGHGDPETDGLALKALARAVADTGLRRITGRVIGGIGPFARDWFAPGWRDYFPDVYIPLPTALAYKENTGNGGGHITDPERRAAASLTTRLEGAGVAVGKAPDAAQLPGDLHPLATVRSAPLSDMLRRMNVRSRNFWAEVLGKHLALDIRGRATIADTGRVACAFAVRHRQDFTCHDGSGLSYDNRMTAEGIVDLLWVANAKPWAAALRGSLPMAGQGTLEDRLAGVRLRAKTGTLIDASALSGWLWTDQGGRVEFSILSSGYDDQAAKDLEDRILRLLEAEATDPTP
jgi:D-alanyl-D-alanine carboxypeptidase/D-alanyl-D-alanine-endopeptidase (penicillin-binding protein 4)